VFEHAINREIGDMILRRGDPLRGAAIPSTEKCGRQVTCARCDPERVWGLNQMNRTDVQAMDNVDHIDEMQQVGRMYGDKMDRPETISVCLIGRPVRQRPDFPTQGKESDRA
jgi:hypothetical protein